MGLTYQDLYTCNPDAIDMVAASWDKLSAAMDGDEAKVQNGVIAALKPAWISKDGRRAVELIGYLGDQLQAVRQESWAMATILHELAVELRSAKAALLAEVDAAGRAGLTVGSDGGISWDSASASGDQKATMAWEARNRITGILQRASDADALAAATMNRNVDFLKGDAKNNFNDWALGAEPAADAIRVADLLKKFKNGEPLSAEDMTYLGLLNQDNAGDVTYATTLLSAVGAEGMLDITRATASPGMNPAMSKGDLTALQDTLRTALSTASGALARDPKMQQWMADLQKAGARFSGADSMGQNGRYGYQDLDVLLRRGQYDTEFLMKVGDLLMEADRVLGNGRGWQARTEAEDPILGFMLTLKNNPDAATTFFSGPKGKEHVTQVAFDHVMMDPVSMRTSRPQLDEFGDAVVAATTGRPTSQPMVDALTNVVNTVGTPGAPQVLEESKELRADLTEALAKNAESMHLALVQENADKNLNAVPKGGPTAAITTDALKRVLLDLAAEPSNIEVLKVAEGRYANAALSMTFYGAYDSPAQRDHFLTTFATDVGEAFGTLDSSIAAEYRQSGSSGKDAATTTEARVERWLQSGVTVAGAALTWTVAGRAAAASRAAAAAAAASGSPAPTPRTVPLWVGFTIGSGSSGLNGGIGEFFDMSPPSDPSHDQIYGVYTNGKAESEAFVKAWEDEFRKDSDPDTPGVQPLYGGPNLTTFVGLGYSQTVTPTAMPNN